MSTRSTSREDQVEFTVKPEEDLILEGTERTIIRVHAGTPYSCLMLKTQRFSSLFRHYAKHHGLKKDDLAFFFTEELQNEDTPETVFVQKNDEIIVRRRRKPVPPAPICPDSLFFRQMRNLLDEAEHKDVTFVVGPRKEQVRAHKAVLIARGDYFRALFRKGKSLLPRRRRRRCCGVAAAECARPAPYTPPPPPQAACASPRPTRW